MSILLAIDPGNIESGYVVWDGERVLDKGKVENHDIFEIMTANMNCTHVVIEQVRSYGMAVGATVFDTVFWSGRFYQEWIKNNSDNIPALMARMDVKMHLCHSSKAKDTNIIQALIDRFAPNTSNKGKGTKKEPGFFYGFKKDIWQAFALAVTYYDKKIKKIK